MTGQADVKWIWMAVALVVVAVPVLTVLFDREIRAMQQRVTELDHRIDALTSADGGGVDAPRIDMAGIEERIAARLSAQLTPQIAAALTAQLTAQIGSQLAAQFAAQQRERELDILRTLSAMRPAEAEFTEEYWVEPQPTEAVGRD